MHPIRFRLGLRPRHRWGSSQRSPRPPGWILRGPISKGMEARGKKERKEEGQRGRGRKERNKRERRGEEKGDEPPPLKISGYATGY